YFIRRPKLVFLSFALGLSAGVMIYISFTQLLPHGIEGLGEGWGVAAFFMGFILIFLIDRLVPEAENPHEFREMGYEQAGTPVKQNPRLLRTGIFTALAIGIHNFPEGLATFAAAMTDARLGVFIAIAVAIHNIPEGISVSVPIFYATGSRKKAFVYSMLSGLAEPIGGVAGYLLLQPFLTPGLIAGLMAAIGGIMVYVSLDELLPMAHKVGHGHIVILGIMIGMAVMAVSLMLL
ncbi:MAG TPA: zinc transporter ZupT, partial [Sedimentisphaerales bacterium]|nr:zinc transporter ZupT [Sedimentisphaerales bacterium]